MLSNMEDDAPLELTKQKTNELLNTLKNYNSKIVNRKKVQSINPSKTVMN